MVERTDAELNPAKAGSTQVIRERLSRNAWRYLMGTLACASAAWLLLGPRISPTFTVGVMTFSAMFALLFLLGEFLTLTQLARTVRSIEIRPEGFTVCRQTRTQQFAWTEVVGEFRVELRETRACVVFEHSQSVSEVDTRRAGPSVEVLADELELHPQQIADRLNSALRAARASTANGGASSL